MRKRADVYMVKVGLATSREHAQRLISSGLVFANGKPVSKAASMVDEGSHITVSEETSYVSRGGLKLEKALHEFGIDAQGKFTVDVGASTGGFTDCLLRHGARAVVAIDVGYGQLAWSLRQDPRVTVMERTNIRFVTPDAIPQLADLVTVDVSFISLEKIHDSIASLLKPGGELVVLVKPQFEAGRERIGKKGVVRDPEVHKDVIENLWDFYEAHGMIVKGLTFSPVKGPEGNIEFLLYLVQGVGGQPNAGKAEIIESVVAAAHQELARQ